jgi:predicted nucleic acid-binding protein
LTLVVDANVAVASCWADGFAWLADPRLAAPPLMWSEARSTLHLAAWRGQASRDGSLAALDRLESAAVDRVDHPELGREAWRVAGELGWGRTYDAEYIALARLLDCRLVTLDRRLLRGTKRLGFVIGPDQI